MQNKLANLGNTTNSGTIGSGVTGVNGGDSLNIQTSSNSALELWGLTINARINAIATAPANTSERISGEFVTTYYQPYPPAANATTPAASTGNLFYRNYFYQFYFNVNSVEPATPNGFSNNRGINAIFLFEKPLRIVGEGLYSYLNVAGNQLGIDYYYTVNWIGKYVGISEQQYVNLVALASGEAILPPSILG